VSATRIIAVRHGETDWNVQARLQGHQDIGLNANGRLQAQQLAEALAHETISAIYASDLSRAWDTACAVAQGTGVTLKAETGLRERCFGAFEGLTPAEVQQRWPEQAQHWRLREPHWAPVGGESLDALRQRVAHTADKLAARYVGEQIVWVTHGGVLDILYRLATGQDLQTPRHWDLGNASINRLLWTPQGLSLVAWSDSRHLQQKALDESNS
jgi:probable phosphoglycerate mutase